MEIGNWKLEIGKSHLCVDALAINPTTNYQLLITKQPEAASC